MSFLVRRLFPFSHNIFGQCVDVICSNDDLYKGNIIHFIIPNDECYLSPVRFAHSIKAEWTPAWEDFTCDFISELFDFPKLQSDSIPKGFIHKGFYLEPSAPFQFKIRGASKVVDEYYSQIAWERDVFNCPRCKASILCLVRASQSNSERIRPYSDINEPTPKTVRFLFPLNEDLLKPILETKEQGTLWHADSLLFSYDKFTKIVNDDFEFPEYKQIPVLVYHTLIPNITNL